MLQGIRRQLFMRMIIGVALAAVVLQAAACSGNSTPQNTTGAADRQVDLHGYQPSGQKTNYVAIVTDQDSEAIIIKLLPDKAPKTAANFQKLVSGKFYDGLLFHRAVPDFVIQGGDPEGTGHGGPGYTIKGEFASNGFENDLKHVRGTVSMARSGDPDSAGSQFFICVAAASNLDGDYAAFGQVLEGMDCVDRIASAPNSGKPNNTPIQDQVMQRVFFVSPAGSAS